MSTVRPAASSEVGPCVGQKVMSELKMVSPMVTMSEETYVDRKSNGDSSNRHSQQTVSSFIIYSYPLD